MTQAETTGLRQDQNKNSPSSDAAADAGSLLALPDLIWIVGSLCQLHRLPFDPQLLAQQFPPPYSRVSLQHALIAFGFKAGLAAWTGNTSELPLPCIAYLRPNAETSADAGPGTPAVTTLTNVSIGADTTGGAQSGAAGNGAGPAEISPGDTARPSAALILKADAERILYFRAGSNEPQTIALAEFAARFEPEILLVALDPESAAAKNIAGKGEVDDEGNPLAKQPFGFSWFVPELLKHKKIWHEVLLASLAIQLVGLTTPLMTQVVIDKIVVHQSMSTSGWSAPRWLSSCSLPAA